MAMPKMCTCTSKHHELLHWKCVLYCCDKWPSIVIPSHEANKDTTNTCLTIIFHVYHNVLHCNMHGLPTYYKQTTCSFYYKMTISYRTEKVYTKKELVLLETSIPEFQESFHISEIKTGISFDTCAYPQKPPLWRRTPRGI